MNAGHSSPTGTSPSRANHAALRYWQLTGYSDQDVDAICESLNSTEMIARLRFDGEGSVEMAISTRTWERQEGHFPAIMKFFNEVAQQPSLRDLRGSMVVWLEDGVWAWNQQHPKKAPILSFGRQITDFHTFLIPDPAFLDTRGYQTDIAEIRQWEQEIHPQHKKRTAFWRGAATGLGIETENWRMSARGRLALLARDLNDPSVLDAKISKVNHLSESQQRIFISENIVGESCPFREFLDYLYLIDADGHCCAWRSLFLKLATSSVVLKITSDYEQWYFHELVPWRHYVPLKSDLSDFMDAYRWLEENREKAREITAGAHELLRTITYYRALEETGALCAAILKCKR
ncbi:MAG: hypothetical protein J5J00_00410 [Deltaproteobacteria bacterium]|nr:hypothetical protein [Deltaproteobacteria bacterium]